MALDFPKTADVWDKDTSYKNVFNQIMNFLDGKTKIKILAPGAGHGRFLIQFLREIANRMPDAQVSFVAVEPDQLAIKELHDKLVEEKFTNIKCKIEPTTLEEYLTKNKTHFDLIICLLFFHYVSHCWISLLSGLLKLLKKDGILVFDEIIGETKDDQLILNYIDCDFAKLHSKEKLGSDKTEHLRNFFRQFYNYLLREESILWSSSVKGTNVEKIVHALKPLFKINNKHISAYRASPLEINILDAIKNKKHLPFWYGTMVNTNFERASNEIIKKSDQSDQMLPYLKKCELSVGFRFYIFAQKKRFSDDFLVRHWDATKNKTILDSLHMINSVLPQVSEFGTVTFSSHNLYVHNLQMAAIRLLLTSGVFRWDTKINSIFVVQGKLTQTLRTPKLSKLVILARYSPQPEDRDILLLSWLINYALYARVLNASLSEKFIASGEVVEITMVDSIEELQVEQEYNGQSKIKIRIPTKIKVDINYRENKLKMPTAEITIDPEKLVDENILDKVRRLIWHDVIELDRKEKIPDDIIQLARVVDENVLPVKISTEAGELLESHFSKESEKIIRYLGILLGNVGDTIIFIPIPTVYSIDSHKYESLIGVGIVVQGKIESKDDDDDECEYIRSILTLFFRAFQEAYLGLHWVEVSRRHAMRSAVAAIMGRNMSHNLGSHVLANIVQMEDDSLDKKKAKNLFGFLQQRMDLIAQISTTAPTWTLDMKLGDMINKFNDQKYLGEFIAKFRGLGSDEINVFLANKSRDEAKEIAIPTATIGCHAVFSIMENIIRNAARHGMRNGQKFLDLSIDVEDNHWRFYKLTIKDNCKNGEKAGELNSKLEDTIIDERGQLKTEAWGMKEKKVLACYLRLIAQEDVDEKYRLFLTNPEISDEPPVIKADSKNGNLTYELFLLKAKKVLVISSKQKRNNEFKKAGIDFRNISEFEKMDKKKIIHKFLVIDIRNMNAPTAWIEKNIINGINKLPFRILIVGNISSLSSTLPKNVISWSSFPEIGDSANPDKFYEEIWHKWISSFFRDYQLHVRISNIGVPNNLNVLEEKCDHLENPEKCVLLDHKDESDNSELYKTVACHIPFDSSGGTIYEIIKKTGEELYLKNQLIEMGAINIAIVDDRIWRTKKVCNVGNKYIKKSSKELTTLWKKKGVDIYDVDVAINNFKQFVKTFPNEKYQFLIFHQGEIDEIKKRNREESFKELWKNLKTKVLCTVIDTGRGVPEQAKEDNLRWMPYSLLQECIIEKADHSLSKKRLVDLLVTLKAEENNE